MVFSKSNISGGIEIKEFSLKFIDDSGLVLHTANHFRNI